MESQNCPGWKGPVKIIWSGLSWKREHRGDYLAPCPAASWEPPVVVTPPHPWGGLILTELSCKLLHEWHMCFVFSRTVGFWVLLLVLVATRLYSQVFSCLFKMHLRHVHSSKQNDWLFLPSLWMLASKSLLRNSHISGDPLHVYIYDVNMFTFVYICFLMLSWCLFFPVCAPMWSNCVLASSIYL